MAERATTAKPPGPQGSWPLGNTKQFAASTLGFVKSCMESYDQIAYARIAFRDFYVLLHPDPIDQVLRQNHRNYVKSFAYDGLKTILGNGLLTNEGDFWLKQRRLVQPAFHRSALPGLGKLMLERTEKLVAQWKLLPPGTEINVGKEMLVLTREILTEALFGSTQPIKESERIGELLPILRQYANDKMKNPLKPPLWVPSKSNRELKDAVATLDRIIGGIIEGFKAQKNTRPDCLLSLLMQIEDADTGEKMSPEQLRDELVTLYLAGQETTTNSLSFIFHLLGQNPAEATKIRTQLNEITDYRDPVTIQSLSTLRNAIQETLRIYPPAWAISRQSVSTDTLSGYAIPPEAVLFISIYALHHSPEYWEEPESFLPDRWNQPLKEKRAYLPFGTGPRICIGNHFALMEMQLIMALILKSFRWEVASAKQPDLITPMTLSTREPVRIKLYPHT